MHIASERCGCALKCVRGTCSRVHVSCVHMRCANSNTEHDQAKLHSFLEAVMEDGEWVMLVCLRVIFGLVCACAHVWPYFRVWPWCSLVFATHMAARSSHWLDLVSVPGLVMDGVVAADDTQAMRLWALRENVAAGLSASGTSVVVVVVVVCCCCWVCQSTGAVLLCREECVFSSHFCCHFRLLRSLLCHVGPAVCFASCFLFVFAGIVYKYDLSLPLEKMYELVEVTRERLKKHLPDDESSSAVVVG